MPNIPSTINNVQVNFASGVSKEVDQHMIDGLKHCIKQGIAQRNPLQSIWIASASDSHQLPSRHAQSKAVDISRINGTKIVLGYPSNPAVKAIVDAIQDEFETYSHRRENYGPHFKKKLGQNWSVSGHDDHVHVSVN